MKGVPTMAKKSIKRLINDGGGLGEAGGKGCRDQKHRSMQSSTPTIKPRTNSHWRLFRYLLTLQMPKNILRAAEARRLGLRRFNGASCHVALGGCGYENL